MITCICILHGQLMMGPWWALLLWIVFALDHLSRATPRRGPDRMLFVHKPDPTCRAGRRISSNPTETSPTLDTKPCVREQSQVGASALPPCSVRHRRRPRDLDEES